MDVLVKIFQQTTWQIFGKVFTALSTIIILGLISRQFGEAGTGILTLALAYLGFFTLAVDFGINAQVLPLFLEKNISLSWQKLLGLRMMLAGLLVILAIVLILLWPNQDSSFKLAIILGMVGILESALFISATAVFQSRLRFDLVILATILGTLTTLVAVFFLVRFHSIPALMLGYILGWIVSGITSIIYLKQFVHNLKPVFDLKFAWSILKNVWPISATLLVNLIYFRIDAFMLSSFRSLVEVGVYNLSYQIFQSALVLPTFIMNSFYPLMLTDFQSNRAKFITNLQKGALAMFGIGLLGLIVTQFMAPVVIELITGGQGFIGSVESLRILSWGFPAFFLSSVLMWSLIAMKKYQTMLVIYLVGLVVNFTLNWNYIPHYSYLAASWVTVVSEYLILALQLLILFKPQKR